MIAWVFKKKHFRKDTWFSLPTTETPTKLPSPKKLTAKAPVKTSSFFQSYQFSGLPAVSFQDPTPQNSTWK